VGDSRRELHDFAPQSNRQGNKSVSVSGLVGRPTFAVHPLPIYASLLHLLPLYASDATRPERHIFNIALPLYDSITPILWFKSQSSSLSLDLIAEQHTLAIFAQDAAEEVLAFDQGAVGQILAVRDRRTGTCRWGQDTRPRRRG